MCRASSPGKKSELYPECSGEERKEVEKAVLRVGQKGVRKKKMNTFASNSHLSAAVRLIDGGSRALHRAWAFEKTLILFSLYLYYSPKCSHMNVKSLSFAGFGKRSSPTPPLPRLDDLS